MLNRMHNPIIKFTSNIKKLAVITSIICEYLVITSTLDSYLFLLVLKIFKNAYFSIGTSLVKHMQGSSVKGG
jgi:hypothetical protein